MSGNIIFFSYITASLIGMAALALMMALCLRGDERKAKIYQSSFFFILNLVFTSGFYFIMEYIYNVEKVWETGAILRSLDFILLCSLPCAFGYMAYCFFESTRTKKILKWLFVVTIVRLIVVEFENFFMLNEYYEVIGKSRREIAFVIDSVFILAVIFLVVHMVFRSLLCEGKASHKRYIVVCGTMIIINELNNLWWQLAYSDSLYKLVPPKPYIEIIGFALIVIGIVSIVLAFKANIEPWYETQKEAMVQNIEILAKQYKITPREEEIMECIYCGMNNADIAKALFISVNTVKHHIYNAYSKLGISSRTELINMINSQQSYLKKRRK